AGGGGRRAREAGPTPHPPYRIRQPGWQLPAAAAGPHSRATARLGIPRSRASAWIHLSAWFVVEKIRDVVTSDSAGTAEPKERLFPEDEMAQRVLGLLVAHERGEQPPLVEHLRERVRRRAVEPGELAAAGPAGGLALGRRHPALARQIAPEPFDRRILVRVRRARPER